MKKIYLVLFFTTVIFNILKAQDLIITDTGDSLNCNITKVKSNYIYFVFMQGNEVRRTLLPTQKVKQYIKGFYSNSLVPLNLVKTPTTYQKFRIGVNGGYSSRVARVDNSISPALVSHIKALKSGYQLGIDAGYFFSENIGVGFKYNNFSSQNQTDNLILTNNNTNQVSYGSLNTTSNINYASPVLYTRFISANKKTIFFSNFSIGYTGYKEVNSGILNFTSTAGSVGFGIDLGVDFMLNKNLALGLNAGYTNGNLNQFELDHGTYKEKLQLAKGQFESLARLGVGVGLSWVW